jgi:hypothetical protein
MERGRPKKRGSPLSLPKRKLPLQQLPSKSSLPSALSTQSESKPVYKGIMNRHLNLKRLFGPFQIFQIQGIFQEFINRP